MVLLANRVSALVATSISTSVSSASLSLKTFSARRRNSAAPSWCAAATAGPRSEADFFFARGIFKKPKLPPSRAALQKQNSFYEGYADFYVAESCRGSSVARAHGLHRL